MKKGFTIVELLAVIAILAILAIIAIPASTGISKNIKQKMYCSKVDNIIQSAKQWGSKNLKSLNSSCYIERTVSQLIDDGFLKKENDTVGNYIINPYNNKPMDNMTIRLYLNNNRAAAWYNETDSTLKDFCEQTYTNRPTRKC